MDFDCFNCDVSRVISQYPDFLHYSMKLALFRNRKLDPLYVPCGGEVRGKEELFNEIETPREKEL